MIFLILKICHSNKIVTGIASKTIIAILTVLLLSFELFLGRSIGRFDFVPKAIISNATDTPIIPQLNQVGKVLAEKFRNIFQVYNQTEYEQYCAKKVRRFFEKQKAFVFSFVFFGGKFSVVVFKKVQISGSVLLI